MGFFNLKRTYPFYQKGYVLFFEVGDVLFETVA